MVLTAYSQQRLPVFVNSRIEHVIEQSMCADNEIKNDFPENEYPSPRKAPLLE
jgi:hypothetical protein